MPRFLAREALGASPGREPPKADLTRRAILTSDTGLAKTLSGGRVAVAASGTHGVTAASIGPVFTNSFSVARFLTKITTQTTLKMIGTVTCRI